MAKIKFGMMMVDARGKLGGQVFSKNASGAYVRTKVTPSNPQTTRQSAVRAVFGAISQGWSTLSVSARNGFREAVQDWARTDIFGDLKNPTGKALFQQLNNQAQAAGWPAVLEVPAKQEMPTDIVESVTVADALATATVVGYSTGAAVRVVVFSTAPLTAGTKFVKNRLRQIYTETGNDFDPTDLYAAYKDKFSAPAPGANIYFGIKYVLENGQASPMQVIKAAVTA